MTRTERSFPVAFRALAAACALICLAFLGPSAGAQTAVSQSDVASAKSRAERYRQQLDQLNAELTQIRTELNAAAVEVGRRQSLLEQVSADLLATRERIDATRARFERIQRHLNDRAAQAFMQGPGTNLEVFLGAQSIADLSDRIEFVSSVTESDAELAQQVENLRSSLAVDEANYQDLQSQRRDQLRQAESQQASIKADLARQQELQAQADALYQEASSYYQKKVDQRQEYMRALRQQRRQAAQSGGHAPVAVPGGFVYPLQVCPVQGAVSFGDGFGAPRYAGGFHLHAGVDMLANYGTPIVAPFDGVARSSYNTLGGNAVFVTGRYGYVYNAHLQSYSDHSNGPVHAGDVIGYVGDTGDAIGTPHDHFEYHPNVIPAGWPSSAYGYSVVGGAINPYPLLVKVCG